MATLTRILTKQVSAVTHQSYRISQFFQYVEVKRNNGWVFHTERHWNNRSIHTNRASISSVYLYVKSFWSISCLGPPRVPGQRGAEMSPHQHGGQCCHVKIRQELSSPIREIGLQPRGCEAEAGKTHDPVREDPLLPPR